jgi:hypothetical protein
MDWIDLAQDSDQLRVVGNTVKSLQFPQNIEKYLSNCATGSFLRRAVLHRVRSIRRLHSVKMIDRLMYDEVSFQKLSFLNVGTIQALSWRD